VGIHAYSVAEIRIQTTPTQALGPAQESNGKSLDLGLSSVGGVPYFGSANKEIHI